MERLIEFNINDTERLINDDLIKKNLEERGIDISDFLKSSIKHCYITHGEYIVFGIIDKLLFYSYNGEEKYFDAMYSRLSEVDFNISKL